MTCVCSVVDTIAITDRLPGAQKTRDFERFDVSSRRSSRRGAFRGSHVPSELVETAETDESAERRERRELRDDGPSLPRGQDQGPRGSRDFLTGSQTTPPVIARVMGRGPDESLPRSAQGRKSAVMTMTSSQARVFDLQRSTSRPRRPESETEIPPESSRCSESRQPLCAFRPTPLQLLPSLPSPSWRYERVGHGACFGEWGRGSGPVGDRRGSNEETAR